MRCKFISLGFVWIFMLVDGGEVTKLVCWSGDITTLVGWCGENTRLDCWSWVSKLVVWDWNVALLLVRSITRIISICTENRMLLGILLSCSNKNSLSQSLSSLARRCSLFSIPDLKTVTISSASRETLSPFLHFPTVCCGLGRTLSCSWSLNPPSPESFTISSATASSILFEVALHLTVGPMNESCWW